MDTLTWAGWIFVAIQVLGTLLVISKVGRPRSPYTGAEAVVTLLGTVTLIWLLLTVGYT